MKRCHDLFGDGGSRGTIVASSRGSCCYCNGYLMLPLSGCRTWCCLGRPRVARCRHRAMTAKKDRGTLFILRARCPGLGASMSRTWRKSGAQRGGTTSTLSLFLSLSYPKKMVTCWHHLDLLNETVPRSIFRWWQSWHDRGTQAVRRSLGPITTPSSLKALHWLRRSVGEREHGGSSVHQGAQSWC
jgi:hypothetical protein